MVCDAQGGSDLNAQDVDGWTPLHASAHWGQREACQILCENLADMEIRNYVVRTLSFLFSLERPRRQEQP